MLHETSSRNKRAAAETREQLQKQDRPAAKIREQLQKQDRPAVSISYIEIAGTTATRQKALKEQYLFSCTCIRCIMLGQNDDIQESAVLEGYRCKDKRCTGFLLRDSGFTCQLCGLVRDKEEIKNTVHEIQSLSEKASFSLPCGRILCI
uniref:Uncharacterized protein n=1 Tax=Solanum lycopersicum TaxID=4081 RepID=K4AV87_SOLLC